MKSAILAVALITIGSFAGRANAALTVQVTEYTSSAISFTISGTLDLDTIGPQRAGLLLLAPSADLNTQWFTGALSIDSNSLTVGGVLRTPIGFDNGGESGDSIYWSGVGGDDAVISAGTAIAGSARLTGSINDSFSITDFKLFSGLASNRTPTRLEATASIPEPSSVLLVGIGSLALAILLRRRK